jgi:hypothetical protein
MKIQRILINFAGVLGVPLVDLVDLLSEVLEVPLMDLVDLSEVLGGPFDSLLAVFSFGKGSSKRETTYPRWGRGSRSNLVSSA